MAKQIGNGFESDAFAVQSRGKSVAQRMNPVWDNATTCKATAHGTADMMRLQRLPQWRLLPDK